MRGCRTGYPPPIIGLECIMVIDPVHLKYHTPARDGEKKPMYDYEKLVGAFHQNDVPYTVFEHRPIFSVEDGVGIKESISGQPVKNLFLRDKKRTPYLVTVLSNRRVDLKALRHHLGTSGNLSFGNEEMLWQHLGVRPGSVNPFAIVNDTEHQVTPIVDTGIFNDDLFNAHPLRNDKSISMAGNDLKRLYTIWEREPLFINFDDFEV